MKVCKFGGTSMANALSIKIVANILRADETRRFVVVSAPGKRYEGDEKVTDLLFRLKRQYDEGADFQAVLQKLESRVFELENELGADINSKREFEIIVRNMREGKGADYVASRGEYLSAKLFAKFVGLPFVDSKTLVKFKDGALDYEATIDALRSALAGLKGAVMPGFYGSDENGEIKTFSRGGSDVTGSLVARAICADVYENWTDVDGVYDSNPKTNKSAKLIDRLTYGEMFDLALNGANVLHKDAVFPVLEAGIPINIRNTFNPAAVGTWIEKE